MAQNPLLGNHISLISKKNIRYEGILYSINETNSTLALQNVKSFGTEGREKNDPSTAFVAPQDGIHAYLLFRGCDIKDLHVHEQQEETDSSKAAATKSESKQPVDATAPETASTPQTTEKTDKIENAKDTDLPPPPPVPETTTSPATKKEYQLSGSSKKERPTSATNNSNSQRRSNPRRNTAAVGTGASLLNRKARGAVQGGPGPENPEGEFDIQAKLEEFDKGKDNPQKDANYEEDSDEAGDEIVQPQHNDSAYEKDDFFDSISCDALDKKSGRDNRLRGKEERSLNTETFGATALNSQRRRRGRGGGRGGYNGRGGGRGGGYRGRGGGRGRGRGGGGRGRYRNSSSDGGSDKYNTPQGANASGNNSNNMGPSMQSTSASS